MFGDASFGRMDSVALGGESQDVARMFEEMTNQDDDKGKKNGDAGEGSAPDRVGGTWDEGEEMELFFDGP
jgi:hypothetical protein